MSIELHNPIRIATRLNLRLSQVERLIAQGAFPVVHMPDGRVRIDPADVAKWVERAKTKPKGDTPVFLQDLSS